MEKKKLFGAENWLKNRTIFVQSQTLTFQIYKHQGKLLKTSQCRSTAWQHTNTKNRFKD